MSGHLRGRRVLVTGGTGFIGSRLVARLKGARAEVHLLARPSSSPSRIGGTWDKVTRHVGDLSDAESLTACVRSARPEFVFHLAKDREDPSFKKEAAATTRLAGALRQGCPGLVRWVRTAHAVREESGRGADAELAKVVAERFRLPIVTLELFQVYGPGQGSGDPPLGALREALAGKSVENAGMKDFVYVEDVAQAYELAALASGVEGATFQIGSGKLVHESEAVRLALKKKGRKPTAVDPGHPADLAPARALGWEPRTGLEEGLAHLLKWWNADQGARGR